MKDDLIRRQAAIDALHMHLMYRMGTDSNKKRLDDWINGVPSAQPETHEKRTETYACDCISRREATQTTLEFIVEYLGGAFDENFQKMLTERINALPPAEPEYKPVTAEDFAKEMSENTLYSFMAWYGEALVLMKEQGFVICKKTL